MILILVLIIILVLVLILIFVLVVILILPVIVVLIVLILILILILLVITAIATFILQHLLGIGIILFRVQIPGITEQGLFVGIYSGLPVLLLDSDVAKVVIIVSGIGRHRSDILQSFQRLSGLIVIPFTIKSPGKVVIGGE